MIFAVPTVDTRTPADRLMIEKKNRDIRGFDDFTIRDLISPVQWPPVVVSSAIQGQFTVAGERATGLRIQCQGSRYAQLCVSLSGLGRNFGGGPVPASPDCARGHGSPRGKPEQVAGLRHGLCFVSLNYQDSRKAAG